MGDEPEESREDVIGEDGRYPIEAYAFLEAGLARAVKDSCGEPQPGEHHHVTGRQLCMALRQLALERWGLLARAVLRRWNINATIDFGNMVYLLVEHGFMGKTDEDSLDDFRDVYDFATAFNAEQELEPH